MQNVSCGDCVQLLCGCQKRFSTMISSVVAHHSFTGCAPESVKLVNSQKPTWIGVEKTIGSCGRCEEGMADGLSYPKRSDCRKVAAKWALKVMTNEPKLIAWWCKEEGNRAAFETLCLRNKFTVIINILL